MTPNYQECLTLIEKFYEKARYDILIGYHFRHIKDFTDHNKRIANFWYHQFHGEYHEPQEKFQLIKAHADLGIKIGELNRWIFLFLQTLDEFYTYDDLKTPWKQKLDFLKDKFLANPKLFAQ